MLSSLGNAIRHSPITQRQSPEPSLAWFQKATKRVMREVRTGPSGSSLMSLKAAVTVCLAPNKLDRTP